MHGAGVADQQGAGVAVGDGLLFGQLLRDVPARAQPDVAVRVDQPGDDPAVQDQVRRGGRTVGRSAGRPRTTGPWRSVSGPVRTVPLNSMMRVMASSLDRGPARASSHAPAHRTPCGSFVYDHTGAPAGAEIGLTQPATVEPVRVMPAKEVSSPLSTTETQHSPVHNEAVLELPGQDQPPARHPVVEVPFAGVHHGRRTRHPRSGDGNRAGRLPRRRRQRPVPRVPHRRARAATRSAGWSRSGPPGLRPGRTPNPTAAGSRDLLDDGRSAVRRGAASAEWRGAPPAPRRDVAAGGHSFARRAEGEVTPEMESSPCGRTRPRARPHRGGRRPRHHPGQRQPPGIEPMGIGKAPGEDQRQHRQLGRHHLDRRGGGEAPAGRPWAPTR